MQMRDDGANAGEPSLPIVIARWPITTRTLLVRGAWLLIGVGVGVALAREIAGPSRQTPLRGAGGFEIPRTAGSMRLDGKPVEATWQVVAGRTGPFIAPSGAAAVPQSEARFAWGGGRLFVYFHAADPDVASRASGHDAAFAADDDRLHFEIRHDGRLYAFDVAPAKVVSDASCDEASGACAATGLDAAWESGAELGVDIDGTLGDSRDRDAGWAVEIAIPLHAIGLTGAAGERLDVSMERCDTQGGVRSCGVSGTPSRPRPLALAAR